MLQEAGELKKPTLMVPYHVATMSEGGFGYTAHSASNATTVCFTDWIGHGMQVESPVFQSIFTQFMTELGSVQNGMSSPKTQPVSFHSVVELAQHPHRQLNTVAAVPALSGTTSPLLAKVPLRAKKVRPNHDGTTTPPRNQGHSKISDSKKEWMKHHLAGTEGFTHHKLHRSRKSRR